MLDAIFSSAVSESLTMGKTMVIIASALILGLIISRAYISTHREEGYSSSFPVTLIMLPAIIAIIILMIGDNIARAFSLAGAFSLIRFRSAAGEPKDIAYIFFSLAVGLACGMAHIQYAALFAVILCGVMLVLHKIKYASPPNTGMLLKISVPENLNYQSLFDDVLGRYADSWQLQKVKTSDFGALFNIIYRIQLKAGSSQKDFLDELRCRNGNLDISLTLNEFDNKVYY